MKNLLQPSKLRAALWILGGIILLLLSFGLGVFVGSRGTSFRARFGENYFRNFYGEPVPVQFGGSGGSMVMVQGPQNANGVIGKVVNRATSTLAVLDPDGEEVSVAVPTGTVIEEGGSAVGLGAVNSGDMVAVIGAPNGQGQISARFIRVFPAASSTAPPPFPAPGGAY